MAAVQSDIPVVSSSSSSSCQSAATQVSLCMSSRGPKLESKETLCLSFTCLEKLLMGTGYVQLQCLLFAIIIHLEVIMLYVKFGSWI